MFSEVHFRNIIFIQNNVPSQSPAQRVSQFTHPIKADFRMFAFQISCEFVKNKRQPQIAGSILNANDRNSENTSFLSYLPQVILSDIILEALCTLESNRF